MTGLPLPPKASTSGLYGYQGYNLLNPRPLENAFGAGGYFALNPTSTGTGSAASGNGNASAPNTITVGGGIPDYASAIENDPAYTALKNLLSAQGISDAAHLRGAVQQALIQFGDVPNLPQDVLSSSGLDVGGTRAQAQSNPFSVLKSLAQKYQQQQALTKNQLAARGILSSGETGYQLGRLGQQQAQDQYNLTSNLLGNIDTLETQYAAGRQAAAQQLANGALTAENNVVNSGVAPQTVSATWDPTVGLYRDANGNLYDPSGNSVSLPGPTGTGTTTPPAPTPPLNSGAAATPVPFQQAAAGNLPGTRLPGTAFAA